MAIGPFKGESTATGYREHMAAAKAHKAAGRWADAAASYRAAAACIIVVNKASMDAECAAERMDEKAQA